MDISSWEMTGIWQEYDGDMTGIGTSAASRLLGWLGTPCWVFTCTQDASVTMLKILVILIILLIMDDI